jgi:hypothetical protein
MGAEMMYLRLRRNRVSWKTAIFSLRTTKAEVR